MLAVVLLWLRLRDSVAELPLRVNTEVSMITLLESAHDLHDDRHLWTSSASLAGSRIQVEFSVHSLDHSMLVLRPVLSWPSSLLAGVLGFDIGYISTTSTNLGRSNEAEGSRTVLHVVALISGAASSNLISRYLHIA